MDFASKLYYEKFELKYSMPKSKTGGLSCNFRGFVFSTVFSASTGSIAIIFDFRYSAA